VVEVHLRDVDDIDHHVSSLRNALPRMPSSNEDQIHVKPPYTNPPISNQEHHLIHPYLDTLDHLLSYADSHSNGPWQPNSRGLNPYDPHGDDHPDLANLGRSPATAGPTVVRDGAEFKPKLHGRRKKSADAEPRLQSQHLTEEAFAKMVPVQEKQGILGAVALPMAMATTAMGLFNRAQIKNLCSELF
jgi:hypothetical protein